MPAHLDAPVAGTAIDPLSFQVRGWVWLAASHAEIGTVEAYVGDTLVGSTATLYARPDVTAALSLPSEALAGFEFFSHHPTALFGASFDLRLHARLRDGTLSAPLAAVAVSAIARDYRQNHFGVLLDQRTTAIQGRANIFAEGPSLAEGSGEVALLLRRHLGPPPCRVIDVGCGLGSYGRGLLADGYEWMGAEIDPADCAELARLGLPHRHVDGRVLPFDDAAFDAAICLEVFEHLTEPAAVLAEIRRVAPSQILVSVPNCELLGYLWDHLATPWHMLESDHKNFFTRHSLGALLRTQYARVELGFHTPYPLRTVQGTPLHYHLFAIATNP
jgi:SAM-dependent methyltransferase